MHMARLWDSSRAKGGKGGYSLESLSTDASLAFEELGRHLDTFTSGGIKFEGKTSMKELFGVPNVRKDGTEGKLVRECGVEAAGLLLPPPQAAVTGAVARRLRGWRSGLRSCSASAPWPRSPAL